MEILDFGYDSKLLINDVIYMMTSKVTMYDLMKMTTLLLRTNNTSKPIYSEKGSHPNSWLVLEPITFH